MQNVFPWHKALSCTSLWCWVWRSNEGRATLLRERGSRSRSRDQAGLVGEGRFPNWQDEPGPRKRVKGVGEVLEGPCCPLPLQPTHQCHAQESHARVRELVVPQHQGRQPLPLLLEALADVGQTWGGPWASLVCGRGLSPGDAGPGATLRVLRKPRPGLPSPTGSGPTTWDLAHTASQSQRSFFLSVSR